MQFSTEKKLQKHLSSKNVHRRFLYFSRGLRFALRARTHALASLARVNMKNQKSSKTLQNVSKSKQKQTQHQTQGKSVLFIFFENITFRTYFVNSHTLS